MELADLVKAVNDFVGGDKAKAKDVAKALRSDSKDVAQLLINVGAGQKSGETQAKVTDLETKLRETEEKLAEVTSEFAEHKAKTPDVATVEARERAKWEPKVKAKEDELKAARETTKNVLKRGAVARFTRELIKAGVDPEYAQEVAANKYGDRFDPKDDGTLGVLQVGEAIEYDAADEDSKIAALAADVRKGIAPRWILTNADSGAGVRNGGGGGAGYDAKKEGEAMAAKEKSSAANNKLAFT